jgi:hypothetical protein
MGDGLKYRTRHVLKSRWATPPLRVLDRERLLQEKKK